MKKTLLFLPLFTFSLFLFDSNAQTPLTNNVATMYKGKNVYTFSDTIIASILIGMNVIKTLALGDSVRDDEFYIRISDYQGENILTINYCRECILTKIIKISDRSYNASGNLFLPIIFGYDLEFSTLFLDERGFKTNIIAGGYYIVFDNRGRVKKTGLSQ